MAIQQRALPVSYTHLVSSHKIHGPKGVGFLYINSKAKVQPLILGGGQQNGMRSGTDNVPGIAGLGVAAKMMYQNFDEKVEHLYQLKERMAEGLSKIDDVVINGMPVRAVSYTHRLHHLKRSGEEKTV